MAVFENEIKQYLPLHKLDTLAADDQGIANLVDDDLFLISQISAYTTGDQDAVTVSKKLRYGNFACKLSSDFSIAELKQLSALSRSIADLSAIVDDNFIKKYGTQTCALVSADSINTSFCIADYITLSDGQLVDVSYMPLDINEMLSGLVVCAGVINGDMLKSPTQYDLMSFASEHYVVDNDCYLDIQISAQEFDSSLKPVKLQISASIDGTSLWKDIYWFNNPGGFPSQPYINYYNATIPVKKGSVIRLWSGTESQDEDDNIYIPDGIAIITEYAMHGTVAENALSDYVKRNAYDLNPLETASLCKIAYNKYGLITSAIPVDISTASLENLGLVRLSQTNGTRFGLSANANGNAYVDVLSATPSRFGTVKVSAKNNDYDGNVFLDEATGQAKVNFPIFNHASDGDMSANVYIGNDNVVKVRYRTSTVSFTPSQVTTLSSNSMIAVNAQGSSIANKISYGDLSCQISKSLAIPANLSLENVISCPVCDDSEYIQMQCSATIDSSGLYHFCVARNGHDIQSSLKSTDPCFCSIIVNGIVIESANAAYWNKCIWLEDGSTVMLDAFTESNPNDKSSGFRAISKVVCD